MVGAPDVQHHPVARSATLPHLRRGVSWLAPLLIRAARTVGPGPVNSDTMKVGACPDFPTTNMRSAIRFLAVVTIAALLAPSARWVAPSPLEQACACPPGACMCAGHQHGRGGVGVCCLDKGGQCGWQCPDSYLSALLGSLIYMPAEHPWWNSVAVSNTGRDVTIPDLLPSHARIPEQPPRVAHLSAHSD